VDVQQAGQVDYDEIGKDVVREDKLEIEDHVLSKIGCCVLCRVNATSTGSIYSSTTSNTKARAIPLPISNSWDPTCIRSG
jgi:hypothetical protein